MKYPCDLIRDWLPLYQDGVCSEESRAAVEEHLRECPSCRAYQTALCEADGLFPVPGEEPEQTADQELRLSLIHICTGMCGGCRVTVGGQVKFACVDGPDFDGHQVDFDELMKRNGIYQEQEQEENRCLDCRMQRLADELIRR